MSQKPRKRSWEINDLAWKIRTDTLAQKMLLVFLGKAANDKGESWYSYAGISEQTGLCNESIRQHAIYLNDLGVLDWESGGGRKNNRYKLKLEAMKTLVAQQAQHTTQQQAPCQPVASSVCYSVASCLPVDGRSLLPTSKLPATQQQAPCQPAERNPLISLSNAQTTLTEPGPGPVSSREGFVPLASGEKSTKPRDSAQRAGAPKEEAQAPSLRQHHSGTSFAPWWGNPLSGCRWVSGENCGYVSDATGKRLSFEDARRVAEGAI